MLESDTTATALTALFHELRMIIARGRAGPPTITIVVQLPDDPDPWVITPGAQNPAASFGLLRTVLVNYLLD